MERYLGMDVHGESTTVVVLSAAGKAVRRDRVETNGRALVGYVKAQAGRLHICLEEGEWSQWLYEILSPYAVEVVVYRPRWRPGAKSDRIDAHALAERLRTGRVGCPVYKAPRRWAQLRESVRVYGKVRQDVVRAKQRLKSLFRRRGVACRSVEIYDPARRELGLRRLPAALRPAAELLGRELDGLEVLRDEAERAMLKEARRFPITRILQTAPGIGPKRAAELVSIVVTPHRFRTKRQFWSYSGFAVVTRSSADWVQVGGRWQRAPVVQTRGLNRACNHQLKALFKGAATTVIRRAGPNPLKEKYEQLLAAGTRPNLAKLTIARMIAAIVLAMWKTETEYQPVR
ncbi:MAG: IS110 family transposase [Gemmatimonadota bacterium]